MRGEKIVTRCFDSAYVGELMELHQLLPHH